MRKMNYLHRNRIIYRRFPTTDKPTEVTDDYMYYENGTHQCYELFRSKAKITSIKSLIWHLSVIWYLNPNVSKDQFIEITEYICDINNNFITFTINGQKINEIIEYVYKQDLERPPKNKARKIIFRDTCTLDIYEKLKIVGSIIGKSKKIEEGDIYEAMITLNDNKQKITINKLSNSLGVTTRTIYRRMNEDLKKEKNILNQLLDEKIQC